jgi:hypothetical protein
MENNKIENKAEFHYNREERLSLLPEFERPRKKEKGIFKNNKSLSIILLDLIIITALSSGYFIYTKISQNIISDSNYSFSLNSYIFDNNILITLVIKNKGNATKQATPAPFKAIITMEDNHEFYKIFFDNMPENEGSDIILRTSTPANANSKNETKKNIIHAVVEYNESIIRLKCISKGEK